MANALAEKEVEVRPITWAEIEASVQAVEHKRKTWLAVRSHFDPEFPDAEVDPAILIGEEQYRCISQPLVIQINDLLRLTAVPFIDESARSLVLKIDRFREDWITWAANVAQNSDGNYDHSSRPDAPTVWEAWNLVLKSLITKEYPLPEGIKTLMGEPEMRHNQIAEIYGWKRKDGSPDTDKVKAEFLEPGTHYNPDTWISPEIDRKKKKVSKAWAEREIIKVDPRHFLKDPVTRKKSFERPPIAPEPIELLLSMQDMGDAQIADMKHITVEDVKNLRIKLRIPGDYQDAVAQDPRIADDPNTMAMSQGELRIRLEMLAEKDGGVNADFPPVSPRFPSGSNESTSRPPKSMADAVVQALQADPEATDATIADSLIETYPKTTVETISALSSGFRAAMASGAEMASQAEQKFADLNNHDLLMHIGSMLKVDLTQFAIECGAGTPEIIAGKGKQQIKTLIMEKKKNSDDS